MLTTVLALAVGATATLGSAAPWPVPVSVAWQTLLAGRGLTCARTATTVAGPAWLPVSLRHPAAPRICSQPPQ